eukprot:5628914-Pyramimonas_sp.AAC.1
MVHEQSRCSPKNLSIASPNGENRRRGSRPLVHLPPPKLATIACHATAPPLGTPTRSSLEPGAAQIA